MPIYELRPAESHAADSDWQLSNYCGVCRVVAVDEHTAREYAALAFAKQGARPWVVKSPWQNPERVKAIFVISGALRLPPNGTIMMPSKDYPGFSPRVKDRHEGDDEEG